MFGFMLVLIKDRFHFAFDVKANLLVWM